MGPAPPSADDQEGFWGPPTSTLDWCEENYVSTHYIAEYWNTISNLFMIVLPIISSVHMWRERVEKRFLYANLGLFDECATASDGCEHNCMNTDGSYVCSFVGIGSWCFHMTLLYKMQLLDELPMVWGSIAMVYISFESCSKHDEVNYRLLAFLMIYCALATVIYLTVINPLFHQVAYGFLVFLLVGRGIYIFRNYGQYLNKFLYVYCTAMYAFAFFLWNIDNNVCPSIRALRKALPFPLDAVTQLHGWWHILAGTSTHCFIVLTCHFRSSYLHQKTELRYTAGLIPFVHHPFGANEVNHNM